MFFQLFFTLARSKALIIKLLKTIVSEIAISIDVIVRKTI